MTRAARSARSRMSCPFLASVGLHGLLLGLGAVAGGSITPVAEQPERTFAISWVASALPPEPASAPAPAEPFADDTSEELGDPVSEDPPQLDVDLVESSPEESVVLPPQFEDLPPVDLDPLRLLELGDLGLGLPASAESETVAGVGGDAAGAANPAPVAARAEASGTGSSGPGSTGTGPTGPVAASGTGGSGTGAAGGTAKVVETVLIAGPPPEYPRLSIRRGEQGTVLCRIKVSELGQVVGVDVVESSGFEALDHAAVEGLKLWRFRPRLVDARAVPAAILHRVIFQLTS